jgi:hypothetical protein
MGLERVRPKKFRVSVSKVHYLNEWHKYLEHNTFLKFNQQNWKSKYLTFTQTWPKYKRDIKIKKKEFQSNYFSFEFALSSHLLSNWYLITVLVLFDFCFNHILETGSECTSSKIAINHFVKIIVTNIYGGSLCWKNFRPNLN